MNKKIVFGIILFCAISFIAYTFANPMEEEKGGSTTNGTTVSGSENTGNPSTNESEDKNNNLTENGENENQENITPTTPSVTVVETPTTQTRPSRPSRPSASNTNAKPTGPSTNKPDTEEPKPVKEIRPTTAFNTTSLTNKDVTVTITSEVELLPLEGWTLSQDKKQISKTYTQNTTEQITLKSTEGASVTLEVKINNIDKTFEKITIDKVLNGNSQTIYIKSNKELSPMEGWELSADKKTLSKTYYSNCEEEITIKDLAGNTQTVKVEVNDIYVKPATVYVSSVNVSSPTKVVLTNGETSQINASVSPSNATNKTLTYSSNNPNVTVNNNGLITAKDTNSAIETATITITSNNGKTKTVTVQVVKNIKGHIDVGNETNTNLGFYTRTVRVYVPTSYTKESIQSMKVYGTYQEKIGFNKKISSVVNIDKIPSGEAYVEIKLGIDNEFKGKTLELKANWVGKGSPVIYEITL